ncbi:T9SS type A sorting domain-containing protein [Sediminibacter sp. Hel_I_10]|uniref:T9SS type A sorting domain-containing protein n=1 Tax=Sediminibacter sp. Hel_I_10 TaxID=1392490 RepID=UPI00047A9190|nr:T9SS type A sorting domain-containing protein [Sediminibacter sp. Hel_I_10]
MKKKSLFIIVFLLSLFASAQDWQWIKRGGSNNTLNTSGTTRQEEVYNIVTDSQKNVYVMSQVGYTDTDVEGNEIETYASPTTITDHMISSFSCDGTYRWSKVIGGGGIEVIEDLAIDSDDNVYVAGRVGNCNGSDPSDPYPAQIGEDYVFPNSSSGCASLFYAKFDSEGVFQYIVRPQEPTALSIEIKATSLGFDVQDDIIYWHVWLNQGNHIDGALVNDNPEDSTPYILKYQPDGTFIEAIQMGTIESVSGNRIKYYRNPNNGRHYATMMKQDSQSSIMINGTELNAPSSLVAFDTEGQYLWQRGNTYDINNSLKFFNIDFDPDNNIYISAVMPGFELDSFLGYSMTFSGVPTFLLKTDADANGYIWATHYSDQGTSGDGAMVYSNEEVAYTGRITGTDFSWGDQSLVGPDVNEGQDVLLARFDAATGACTALDKIDSDVGSGENGTAIAVDASGDYLVGGGFGSQLFDVNGNIIQNQGPQTDFFIAKYATEACSALNINSKENNRIDVFPNPSKGVFTVKVLRETQFRLYDITGALLKTGILNQDDNKIDVSGFSAGCYLLQLNTGLHLEVIRILKN